MVFRNVQSKKDRKYGKKKKTNNRRQTEMVFKRCISKKDRKYGKKKKTNNRGQTTTQKRRNTTSDIWCLHTFLKIKQKEYDIRYLVSSHLKIKQYVAHENGDFPES
jgi:hypothetical protein